MGIRDLLPPPHYTPWRRKGRPVSCPLSAVFLVWMVILVELATAQEYTGYCRWVSQADTSKGFEGVHEVYVSFDNTDQTRGLVSLYVDMSARGEPSTRQVYLCPDEFATVKQTYPNSTSPVSIQQSEVTITYNSMSLCMSKAFNFMKNTGLIRRDTSTLTYLLLALNETW